MRTSDESGTGYQPVIRSLNHGLVARATACILALFLPTLVFAQNYTRTHDVIYGRAYGTSLTMDVFQPKTKSNHLGVLALVSGGWFSGVDSIDSPFFKAYIDILTARGYTVFAVVHGSQPKFTIPEILPQIDRAVRFVRFHANDYGIDPDHIGMCGGSAGGHLTLMQAVHPLPDDPKAVDPIDRTSSRIQTAVSFFPPTDFLNYGSPGHDGMGKNELAFFKGAFDFHELDPKAPSFIPITDPVKLHQIGEDISPIYHVTSSAPPILIFHGDADHLVPFQQATSMIAKLEQFHVPCKLIVKKGGGHGWGQMELNIAQLADFFDQNLKRPSTRPALSIPATVPAP